MSPLFCRMAFWILWKNLDPIPGPPIWVHLITIRQIKNNHVMQCHFPHGGRNLIESLGWK